MEQNEQPNYFAIIPADVRYASIPANAKLLYGEITALCNKQGYCWASNKYFADLYGVSNTSISLWVKCLAENNFIKYDVLDNNRRKIYINRALEKVKGGLKKTKGGVLRKLKDNNTVNNTSNTISNKLDIGKELTFKDEQPNEVKRLYYLYVTNNKIPVTNHNVLRTKIKEMQELYGEKWCIDYLNFMLKQYNSVESNYKPVINNALDLYTKSRAIQSLMIKITKEEEIY